MPNHVPFVYVIGPLRGPSGYKIGDNIYQAKTTAFDIQREAHELGMPVITYCPHVETGWLLLDDERCKEIEQNEHLYMRAYLSLLMSGKVDAVVFHWQIAGRRCRINGRGEHGDSGSTGRGQCGNVPAPWNS